MVIDTWSKWDFEIWPLLWFFRGLKCSIWVQLGLPLNINGNDKQNKFKVHISKKVDKIGQDATFAPTLNVHNSAIFI